jgi:TPP-dependent pyruvate/acetoin dehydrogenase alpha subunit
MNWPVSWRDRDWDSATTTEMYRSMVRIREFEREGEVRYNRGDFIGPYHSSVGQEATYVGPTLALRPSDKMTSNHRSHGHQIAKGADLGAIAAEIWGKYSGVCKGKGGSMHVADFSVGALGASALLGGGMGVATGAALAQKLSGDDGVVLCFFGDGAVNEGIFHETLNWAGAWKLPVIFLCENNQYAVTMWYRSITAVDTISKRAVAYGMPGVTVDGQNVLDTFCACEDAVTRARMGQGPTLIECLTYRYDEHSLRMTLPKDRLGSRPDPTGYRLKSEIDQWRNRDPLVLFRAWGAETGRLSDEVAATILEEARADAVAAWQFAADSEWPPEEEIWIDTWPEPVPPTARVVLT